jgi:hypothetical protein
MAFEFAVRGCITLQAALRAAEALVSSKTP